jgi:hypothetical protein
MKVDVSGLMAAARRLTEAATLVQGTGPGELVPLAIDTTSTGAAARLQTAAAELWGSACAQAAGLASAAAHLVLIAAKFATQEEANRYHIVGLQVMATGLDTGALTALEPVPPVAPDVRIPLPPLGANLDGEAFSQMVTAVSGDGTAFTTNATNNGTSADSVARTLRELAASVPDMWESPVGTAALSGRLTEYANAVTTISDRWFALGDETRKHADDHSQTVGAVPKPQEFKENETKLLEAQRQGNGIAASQLLFQRGELLQRAVATATRYAADTELTTSPKGAPAPQAPVGGGAGPAGAATAAQAAAGQPAAAMNKASAGAGEAAQAGQAGDAAGQLAQLLPAALGAIGGMAGGAAGMLGQIPQALMQTGQGLAQAATQGLSGLAKSPANADPAKPGGAFHPEELSKAHAGGGAGGGGAGATHPAGALGPPVTPSTSHNPPTMPAGSPAPAGPTPAGGSAMGGMPMGMPMGGMMGHGAHGGDGAGEKVAPTKKIVVPPQPHTEPVTGKVSDRTAAAAEAARARAESDDPDDQPPRGPVMRRITLAPLDDEGSR